MYFIYIYILFFVYTYGRIMCIHNIVLKYWSQFYYYIFEYAF